MAPRKAPAATKAPPKPLAERKRDLASALLDDAERLRTQLFAPVVVKKPMVVSDGAEMGSHVEVVEVDLEEPTFADKKTIVQAIATVVDQLNDLDDGKAGGGTKRDELEQRRQARRAAAKAAAAPGGGR